MKKFIAIFIILFPLYVLSQPIKLGNLNGYYSTQETISDSIIILLHGTRGHQNLEIISSLREILKENSLDSLSINLSYGITNRNNDFLPCDIKHKHTVSDTLNEIQVWYNYIKKIGYKNIYLLGHSRGGQDITNFYQGLNEKDQALVNAVFLLAPISDSSLDNVEYYKKEFNTDITSITNNDKVKIDFLGCKDASVFGYSFKSYYYNLNISNIIDVLRVTKGKFYIITGSEDTITPYTHERVKQSIKNKKDIELYKIDGAGHFFRDFYFDDLSEIILDKLN